MTLSALVRRCAQFIPVFFGITVLSFALIHLAPSDPVSVRLSLGGIAVDPAAAAQMRTEMGLDRPLPAAYLSICCLLAHAFSPRRHGDILPQ